MRANEEQGIEPGSTWPCAVEKPYSSGAFVLVILMGIAIRFLALYFAAHAPLASDSADYKEMAVLLLGGKSFVPYWPPGLPLYLMPVLVAGGADLALRASMLGWWILFCIAFIRLASDLHVKQKTSLFLLIIFSFMPAWVHFSIEPMTQMPTAALLIIGLSAAVRCSKKTGWGEVLLLGGSLGWLSLVRPSALPLLVLIPALVFIRQRRILQPLLAVGLGCVMIFAWIVKVHQLSGQWAMNGSNGINLFYGNNPWTPLYRTWYFGSHAKPGTEEIRQFPEFEQVLKRVGELPKTQYSATYKHLAVDYVLHRPDLFILRTANRIRCFWGFDIFTAANLRGAGPEGRHWFPFVFVMDAVCYFAMAGFAFFRIASAPGAFWRKWEAVLLIVAIVLYGLPYWISMSHPSYHFPVMAPLVLLGAIASDWSRSTGLIVRRRGWVAFAALVLIQVEWVFILVKS